jgi:acetyl-CoA C-acetyltransferase
MSNVVLLAAARTPHGRLLGPLADVEAVTLGRVALGGLIERAPLAAGQVDWVGLGNAIQAGLGQVPARQVVVGSDLPNSTPATTVNEASGSGLRAVAMAADRIETGRVDAAVAGGMESMSNAPYLVPGMRKGRRHGDATLVDSMIHDALWDRQYDAHMGELTEELAQRFDISRDAQDAYALESHRRAVDAREKGAFDAELVEVPVDDDVVTDDDGPRPDTSLDRLAGLDPAFSPDGTITAGNASDLSDGAGCVLLASEQVAADAGAEPLARVVDYAVVYRDPKWFGMAAADAVQRLLRVNDLSVEDVDVFELNEAFAAQMVYVRDRLGIPADRLNPRGGAIALGHPIGASGGILTTTLAHTLADTDATRGVVGMSVGGGGGIAMLLER